MPICEGCGGTQFTMLGTLGTLTHLRCRSCGLDTTINADELEDEDTDD